MLEVTIFAPGGREIKRYELAGSGPLRVGRSTSCEIQVPLMEVSRRHAEIAQVEEDEWVIRDLESTHGCVVGEERLREVTVRAGLEVRLGTAVMKFSNLADRIGVELNAILEDTDPNAETDGPLGETLKQSETLQLALAGDSGAGMAAVAGTAPKKKSGIFRLL